MFKLELELGRRWGGGGRLLLPKRRNFNSKDAKRRILFVNEKVNTSGVSFSSYRTIMFFISDEAMPRMFNPICF